MSFKDGFAKDSIAAIPTATSGNILTYDGADWVDLNITAVEIGDISSVSVGSNLSGGAVSGDVTIALSNNVTGLDNLETTTLTASTTIVQNLTVLQTASIFQINNVNQQSLNIGDKYITILTGGTDHTTLDGSGILWGQSGSSELTLNEFGSNAHLRFRAVTDSLEVFPSLTVSGSGSISTSGSLTASFLKGDGNKLTNLTASNITNFAADIRKEISGSQYVTYNSSSGVVSLPLTGSLLGTTPLILGQTASIVTGLTSISASTGTFNTLSASSFNLGTMTALTTSTGDLTVNNLIVNGVIENAAGNIQIITGSAYQIIPSTSLVKISAPSGSVTLNTAFPTIKSTGYNEGTRVFIVNVGPNPVTFKDDGAVPGTKLKMANQTYNQPQWGCIQFVLVSGSLGKVWIEAGRGA